MPFNEDWSDDTLFLIKQVGEEMGLKVIRADDIFNPNIIVNDIWRLINKAGLIIADITTHNANVFYELGIAHSIGKDVVLIRQIDGHNAPFDIAFWRFFEYELTLTKAEEFKKKLMMIFQNHLVKFGNSQS
jgi:hypothetical protein